MKHIDFYIKIIVVVPFIGYDSKWPDQSKHRLKKLIQNANDSIVISHSADVSSYKKRNYYMVDHADALKYIRRCEEEYDLIIVDSSDPFGPSEGLFTREFYGSCFNALKADGIMVNQQGSPFYAEDASAMQRSHKRIASTFPISRVYQAHIPTFAAGYWLFGFASKKYHPIDDLDADAWKALNMRTRYYTARLHVGAFYLPAFLEEMLREVEEH